MDEIDNLLDNLINDKRKKVKKKEQMKKENECELCNSVNIIQRDGNNVCMDCGNVGDIVIDETQEWRNYGNNEAKCNDTMRCSSSVNDLLPDMHNCVIYNSGYESKNMKYARKIQIWNSLSYVDLSLLNGFNNIQTIGNNYGINSKIIDEAKNIYKKIIVSINSKKPKKISIQAACLLWAGRNVGASRSCGELADMFGITEKDVRKGVRFFQEIYNTVIDKDDIDTVETSTEDDDTINSLYYLHRYCSNLGIDDNVYAICYSVCRFVEDKEYLTQHIPLSRTASCICFTCGILNIPLNKSNVKKICNCSDVTISKCIMKLNNNHYEIVENTLLKNYV